MIIQLNIIIYVIVANYQPQTKLKNQIDHFYVVQKGMQDVDIFVGHYFSPLDKTHHTNTKYKN